MCYKIILSLIFLIPSYVYAQESISNSSDYASPIDIVEDALAALNPKPNEVFIDPGSGDGRSVITAARIYGCKAIGIEQNLERVLEARIIAKQAGVADKVTFIVGDFNKIKWPRADVGYVYLFPEDLVAIRSKLTKLDRFVSFAHKVEGLPMRNHDDNFYSWKAKPRIPAVRYGNRMYTGPVCNNPRCSMCNTIKRELAAQRGY